MGVFFLEVIETVIFILSGKQFDLFSIVLRPLLYQKTFNLAKN